MSLWGFDGEENTLTSWPSLSQFDDVEWNEFGDNGNHDHDESNPASPSSPPDSWLPQEHGRKRLLAERSLSLTGPIAKRESPVSTGVASSVPGLSSEDDDGSKDVLFIDDAAPLTPAFDEGQWPDVEPGAVDSPEGKPFGSDLRLVSSETTESGDASAKDHESMMVESEGVASYPDVKSVPVISEPLPIPEANVQDGNAPMFTGENMTTKADNLLELGWENMSNLYDMEKLFRTETPAPFEPPIATETDTLAWPSPSSSPVNALTGSVQYSNSALSESSLVRVESNDSAEKAETTLASSLPELAMAVASPDDVNDCESPKSLKISPDLPKQPPSLPGTKQPESSNSKAKSSASGRSGRETSDEKEGTSMSSDAFRDGEKVNPAQGNRARRQASQRKRNDDKSKKTTSYRKLFPGPPYNVPQPDVRLLQTVPLRVGGQPHPLQSPSPIPLQCLPPGAPVALHPVQQAHGNPYFHPGYPVPFAPGMASYPPAQLLMQQFQPRLVDMMRPNGTGERPVTWMNQPTPQASGQPFDAPIGPPPTSSPNMTPKEKLEKLRWRQQMQARMAAEQQQQHLVAVPSGDGSGSPLFDSQQQAMARPSLPNEAEGAMAPISSVDQPMVGPMAVDPRMIAPDGSVLPSPEQPGEGYCLESSVLGQLKTTVSALDLGTRLCIRDALFRLADSAMKRRAAGSKSGLSGHDSQEQDSDANAVESSTASGPPASQQSRDSSLSVVEAQTNSIDRSIANLLFTNPHQGSVFGRPFVYS